ncbi:MAG: MFS transporter [Rhodothermales bacterium]|nr:MFS transporter [Rhodothermales bacterium]
MRGRLGRAASGYPRAFWVLWAGTLVNRLGLVVLPFLTLYLTTVRGLRVEQATLVVGLYGAGTFAASFIGGALADRIGRKAVLVSSLVSGGLLLAMVPLVKGVAAIAALVLAVGFAGEMYRPAVSAAVADLVPEERQGRAFVLIYWAINLGAAVGPAVGGFLAETSYVLLFGLDAATMVAFALIVAVGVPETRPPDEPEVGAVPALRPRRLGVALSDGLLVAITLVTLVVGVVIFQAYSTLPLTMRADGLGERAYGLAITVNGGLVVLLSLPVARWVERRVSGVTLAAAVATVAVGVGLHGVADAFAGYALAVAVWTLGEVAYLPIMPALIARLSPRHLRGTYQGVYAAGWGLAKMLGPVLGGLVFGALGAGVLWASCAAVGFGAAGALLLLRGPLRRRLA